MLMIIGIMADSHDQVPELKRAITVFHDKKTELLIHAGDWVSAFTLEYYKELDCPIRGVWGNNIGDPRFPAIAKKLGLDLEIREHLSMEVEGKRVFVCHELEAHPNQVDVVVYGHDHQAKIEEKNGVLYINPGTLLRETFPWLIKEPSIAIYDTNKHKARLMRLE